MATDDREKSTSDDYDRHGFAKWHGVTTLQAYSDVESDMVMWECPNSHCNKAVSVALIACPHCGWVQPTVGGMRQDRVRKRIALLLILAVFFGFGFWQHGWKAFGIE